MRLLCALALLSLGCATDPAPVSTPDPAPADAPSPTGDGTLAGDIASNSAVLEALREMYGEGWVEASIGAADLDGDGQDEAIAHVAGPDVCGSGGCDTVVLAADGEGYRVVAALGLSRLPVGVAETSTNGWRDLAVSFSGGGMPSGTGRITFDGLTYATNPTTAPPADGIGTVVVSDATETVTLSASGAPGDE